MQCSNLLSCLNLVRIQSKSKHYVEIQLIFKIYLFLNGKSPLVGLLMNFDMLGFEVECSA